MQLAGAYRLEVAPEVVWAALNDPEVLARALPGCERLTRTAPDAFAATVTLRIGPVKASFTGNVTLSELDPPHGYRISGEGTGGAAGFASGSARVRLAEDQGATQLSYTAEAKVGGKLAQLGGRLIEATANKLAEEFFRNLAQQIAGPTAAPEPLPAARPPRVKLVTAIILVAIAVLLAIVARTVF